MFRLSHATPASLYAHSAAREWECDAKMPAEALAASVPDIAAQMVDPDGIATTANVILGGGRAAFRASLDPKLNRWACNRTDGRDLIREWQEAQVIAEMFT